MSGRQLVVKFSFQSFFFAGVLHDTGFNLFTIVSSSLTTFSLLSSTHIRLLFFCLFSWLSSFFCSSLSSVPLLSSVLLLLPWLLFSSSLKCSKSIGFSSKSFYKAPSSFLWRCSAASNSGSSLSAWARKWNTCMQLLRNQAEQNIEKEKKNVKPSCSCPFLWVGFAHFW